MSEFADVTIVREANIYFNGMVTSRTIIFRDGSSKTLGIMLPGEYEFSTASAEIMEIMKGNLKVQLPDSEGWQTITGGGSFKVPANAKFRLKIETITDYCCSFIE